MHGRRDLHGLQIPRDVLDRRVIEQRQPACAIYAGFAWSSGRLHGRRILKLDNLKPFSQLRAPVAVYAAVRPGRRMHDLLACADFVHWSVGGLLYESVGDIGIELEPDLDNIESIKDRVAP